MTKVKVLDVHIGSLFHFLCKRKGILVVNCLDYFMDFFIFTNKSDEFLKFIESCREVDYRIDDRKISVLPKIILLL